MMARDCRTARCQVSKAATTVTSSKTAATSAQPDEDANPTRRGTTSEEALHASHAPVTSSPPPSRTRNADRGNKAVVFICVSGFRATQEQPKQNDNGARAPPLHDNELWQAVCHGGRSRRHEFTSLWTRNHLYYKRLRECRGRAAWRRRPGWRATFRMSTMRARDRSIVVQSCWTTVREDDAPCFGVIGLPGFRSFRLGRGHLVSANGSTDRLSVLARRFGVFADNVHHVQAIFQTGTDAVR